MLCACTRANAIVAHRFSATRVTFVCESAISDDLDAPEFINEGRHDRA